MDIRTKSILEKYIVPYIESINGKKIGKRERLFPCPICRNEKASASIYPENSGKMVCYIPECNFNGDIFELVRHCESMSKWTDYDVKAYLTKLFNIEFPEDFTKDFDLYQKNGWFLFPVVQNESKAPIAGFAWTKDCSDNRKIWQDWHDRGYGVGCVLGKKSGVIAIDIDDEETMKKMKPLLNDTLTQSTKRGSHFVYSYDPDFDFLNHANLRNKSYKDGDVEKRFEMEVRANNAYIVVAPTSCEGEIRTWNDKPMVPMSPELKKFLLDLIDKKNDKDEDESIQEAIDTENIGKIDLSGNRNNTCVKLAGIFSKRLSKDDNSWVLDVIGNNLLDKPFNQREKNASLEQISRYRRFDKEDFANMVLDRLKVISEGTAFQIANSLKKDIKDIEDILKYLEDKQRVLNIGNRKYKALNNVDWTTNVSNLSVPIDFEMPFFHPYAYFSKKNMVIISAPQGGGKTHLVGNLLKGFTDQSINPDLITTEQDGNIGKVTDLIGVPSNSYAIPKVPVSHPTDIELRDNKVTIVDWLKPIHGDYSKTEITFEHFRKQLDRHDGFLIIMSQLRKSDKTYFAADLFEQFGAFVCKYLHTEKNGTVDNLNTYFETTKIRDSKVGKQHLLIPTKYDPDTKLITLRK